MPTASRLVAALILAALAWLVSDMIKPLFEEGKDFGKFNLLNAVIGLCIGWMFVGRRAGLGMMPAVNNGLTGGVLLVLWGLFFQGAYKMFQLSMRGRYDGAFEALADVFQRAAEFAVIMATPPILGALVVGSILSGLGAEMVSRRTS